MPSALRGSHQAGAGAAGGAQPPSLCAVLVPTRLVSASCPGGSAGALDARALRALTRSTRCAYRPSHACARSPSTAHPQQALTPRRTRAPRTLPHTFMVKGTLACSHTRMYVHSQMHTPDNAHVVGTPATTRTRSHTPKMHTHTQKTTTQPHQGHLLRTSTERQDNPRTHAQPRSRPISHMDDPQSHDAHREPHREPRTQTQDTHMKSQPGHSPWAAPALSPPIEAPGSMRRSPARQPEPLRGPSAAPRHIKSECAKIKAKGCDTAVPFPQDSTLTQVLLCNKHFILILKTLALPPWLWIQPDSTSPSALSIGRAERGHRAHPAPWCWPGAPLATRSDCTPPLWALGLAPDKIVGWSEGLEALNLAETPPSFPQGFCLTQGIQSCFHQERHAGEGSLQGAGCAPGSSATPRAPCLQTWLTSHLPAGPTWFLGLAGASGRRNHTMVCESQARCLQSWEAQALLHPRLSTHPGDPGLL